MILQLGHLKNSKQLVIRTLNFGDKSSSSKVVSLETIQSEVLSCLFIDKSLLEDESIKESLLENAKFYPIREAGEAGVDNDNFEKMSFDQLVTIFNKVNQTWTLQNNISLLENMHTVIDHLNALWPNDRTTYFEEFWFLIKKNLGALSLRVIYNDLKKMGKNDDKNTLIQVSIEGDRNPNPVEGGDLEKSLMENYQEEFALHFNMVEYVASKGQLVIAGNIKNSPYIIMANITEISRLQQSVLQNFITALSR
ncbi:hypothetical protein [Bacteriovorax sp. Seq25_V]|uniref:hypothetical protein n=1 Tax=Bacteriovorax sp. Seq25_V TaxID=1201288 RepID=UPI00038A4B44|nr:hypothetical protein [Bacteriovorax sp. Seq25_V]EQC47139.1 hypothetical protein M900_0740 [Bacteriovorax sp. Seq25_V]